MKRVAFFIFFSLSSIVTVTAQSRNEQRLLRALDQLHKAMIEADSASLSRLALQALSYGHSSGQVDSKSEFIRKIVSGASDFVSIRAEDRTVVFSGRNAVVRFRMEAETNDRGQPGRVSLLVLLVWQKKGGEWKLLARQAVKRS